MEEVALIRRLVDIAVHRLETERPDSPLRSLPRPELRRMLAEAAFREVRALQREVDSERPAGS